jgi:hypothetical protein
MQALVPVHMEGDIAEYAPMTVALARHGTPDIQPADMHATAQWLPFTRGPMEALEHNLHTGQKLTDGFYLGNDGNEYALHFWAYSALAALPYRLLPVFGAPPEKCWQVVNAAALFVLGMAMFRLFGTSWRALGGMALYMLCGGVLYWHWSSPECLSAALLLAGLIYFCTGAPLRGGLWTGMAAMQNPSIALALGFAPLLAACLDEQALGWRARLRAQLRWRVAAGMALGAALFALSPLFNLAKFGVPSIIARIGAGFQHVTLARLTGYYFDLNQGMVVAIPTVMAALPLLLLRRREGRMRHALALALGVALTLGFSVPCMMIFNWNSSAAGVMRYAFWGAMPLLLLALWRLRGSAVWPRKVLLAAAMVQAAAMVSATRYNHLQFSPLAAWMLRNAPAWYNPEPETFAERATYTDGPFVDPHKVYAYRSGGVAVKTMIHRDNRDADAMVCGAGKTIANIGRTTAGSGWRYVNGAVNCLPPRQ